MAKSLSQANAAALDSLGESKSNFTTSLSVVEAACADFILRIKENIQSIPNFVNTGKIENLTLESEGQEVNIFGSEHLLYQYYGVNGAKEKLYQTKYSYGVKRPPIAPFLAYIQSKNLRLVNNPKFYGKPSPFKETSEEKEQETLAWALSTSVYNKGIKPKPAIGWEKEKEKLRQDLIKNAKGFVIKNLKSKIYNQYGDDIDKKA
jgi:hypothetical protein